MARYAGGGKNTVESCRSVDVLRWNKLGYLRSPRWFSWVWTRDGERVASINVQTQHHCVTLKYRSRSYGEDWSDVEQRVAVVWTPCRFTASGPGLCVRSPQTGCTAVAASSSCMAMTRTTQTLPAETGGTDITRFNALRHGVLSRYTVLPWESADEYRTVVEALVAEHDPQGPTEEHLVEEIAGILWRKRRLRLAEAAAHRRGLEGTLASYRETVKVALVHLDTTGQSERVVDAIRATVADTDEDITEMETDEAMTRRALNLLGSKRNDAYEAALEALREDTQSWWADTLAGDPDELGEGEEPATADVEGLRHFLEGEVLPWFENRKKELANRPLIREQAFGEALDPDKLERLSRYEVHLDRKLERMLTMLLRLKDLRRTNVEG